jgi:putative ABC transport system permease protein
MKLNYLKIAIRNLLRHKVFSFINIAGFAVGLACTILILHWISDEISYDKYLPDSENIYRINTRIKLNSNDFDSPLSSDMMGATLKKDYPEVKNFTKLYTFNRWKMVKKGDTFISEYRTVYADSNFFSVFQFPVLQGNLKDALTRKNTVVINESTAKKYFGRTNVVGETIETNDKNSKFYKITAVIKDMPSNTHFHFDFIFPMENLNYPFGNYMTTNFYTYIKLKTGTDYKSFEPKLKQYIVNYSWPFIKQLIKVDKFEDFEKAGNVIRHTLIPLTDIHLYSNKLNEIEANGSISYVYILTTIAFFILLIASINFMNLTTANAAKRAREVGIRKVLGSARRRLVSQFLSESLIISYISSFAAIAIVYLILPLFNSISGKKISFDNLFSTTGILILFLLPLAAGLFAGIYPAIMLSRFKPVNVLKGRLLTGSKGFSLRGSLVVFQFAASIILIISTALIYSQLSYMQNKKLGYNKEQVLIIDNTSTLGENIKAFKNEVLLIPGVKEATITGYLPVPSDRNNFTFFKEPVFDINSGFDMQKWAVDYNYIKFMGIKIIKGRDFSEDFVTDSTAMIINQKAAKIIGNNPVGKELYTVTGPDLKTRVSYKIIGIVKDFNYESLKQPIGPLCMILGKNKGSCSIKIESSRASLIIDKAGSIWKSMVPSIPFSYKFMDDSFSKMYIEERNVGLTILSASVFAVLVACLGLFGLSIFMAQQKTKEIGIRNTLGASISAILFMMSKECIKWILIANVIAWPVAYWVINQALLSTYKVEWSIWTFIIPGILVLLLTLLTVSSRALRTAVANPVESLRYE